MSRATRLVAAAAMLVIGLWLSQRVRGLVAFAHVNASRLGFEMMGIEIGVAAVAISIAWALPGSPADRLGLRAGRLPTGAVIALVIGVLGFSHAVDAALSGTRALDRSVIRGISHGLEGARGWSFVVALFGTVIAPAIGEELLCRGLLQRTLAGWLGPLSAVTIASLVFGWIHMEVVHGLIAAAIGCYLGISAYWADSTRAAIAGHAANNFAALLGSAGWLHVQVPAIPGMVIGLALAVFGLAWAWRARPRGGAGHGDADPALQPQRDSAEA